MGASPYFSAVFLVRGVWQSGGGGLLHGFAARLRFETKCSVHVADDPMAGVVRGAGKVLEDLPRFMKGLLKGKRY